MECKTALSSFLQSVLEINHKWRQVTGVAIVHRVGEVPVGEASVMVVVSAPHRKDSLEAVCACTANLLREPRACVQVSKLSFLCTLQVQFGIDTLKERVPIWKKEWYADDDNPPEWKENCEGCTKRHH